MIQIGGDRLGVRKLKFSQGLSALFNAVKELIPLCLLFFNGCFELRAFPGERPELVFILRGRNFPFQIFDFLYPNIEYACASGMSWLSNCRFWFFK